jgi:NADH:ubiquinone oxidoreductase subunit E
MNKAPKSRNIHPGLGEKKALFFAKGRNLSSNDRDAVTNIIGEAPHIRHMLIEYLHAIQDHEGHLTEGHMHALANTF